DELVKAFGRVGVSLDELKTLGDTEKLFEKVADGARELGSQSARTATTLALFGRGGAQIATLLRLSSDEMEKAKQRAKDLGGEVTTLNAIVGDEFQDAMRDSRTASQGLQREIGTQLLPTMIDLANQATDTIVKIRELAQAHPALVRATADTAAQ